MNTNVREERFPLRSPSLDDAGRGDVGERVTHDRHAPHEGRHEGRSAARAMPASHGGRARAGLGPVAAALFDVDVVPVTTRRTHTAKRALDVVLALVGLVISAPLILLLALVIRLDSKGPALLRQTRVGRDGRPFELIKLRSMLAGLRVTRVGRLIRPLGLDELPQLWNVLRGEMSIVGPRPERPHLVAEYQARLVGYAGRHVVRPGITGWAQIHGLRGGERPIAERLCFDLEYVRCHNLGRDLRILALTISAVWRDTRRELQF